MIKVENQRLRFNISGHVFETHSETLDNFPDTLLGNAESREQFYCTQTKQYYFNRNWKCFECILFFYQSKGRLYSPINVNFKYFVNECKFFGIPDSAVHILKVKNREYLREKIRKQHFPDKCENESFRKWLWNTLENPSVNIGATCFYFVQTAAILLSITMSALESYNYDNDGINRERLVIEIVLSTWFFLETTVRAIVAPDRIRFFTSVLNWCDIIAVAPHYIIYAHSNQVALLQQSRFIRVLRILRLRNISPRTKAVCIILEDSASDLYLFFFGLLVAIVFGSSTMYHLEMTHNTDFSSIPAGMWWGVQTFLTVGYGDIVPQTIAGRLFATLFMIVGMDTVLLPVLSLIMKFADFVSNDYLDD